MNRSPSRFNRDVRSQTSVSDRDVSTKRHTSTVTFTRWLSLLSEHLKPTTNPHPVSALMGDSGDTGDTEFGVIA